MIILSRMLVISGYPNDKKTFYTIYEHHCLVRKLQTRVVCPTQNEDESFKFNSIQKESSWKDLNLMTPETETVSPAVGSNGRDDSDASESNSSNGGRRCGQGGRTGRSGHQGRGGRGGRFNRPE